jgi:hypothetical protein
MAAPRPPLALIEGGGGPAPRARIGPALELAALGFGIALTATLIAHLPGGTRSLGTFQTLYAIGFAFLALALVRLARYRGLPRVGMLVFAVALAARVALLGAPPLRSDDLYRYVWEGRVLAHGGNPWTQPPADPALATLRDPRIFPRVNHPQLATIYPPLAEAGFALVASLSPTVWAMKLWILLHDLALVALLCAWCERRTGSAAAAIAYAWNPLVIVEFAGSGHNDPTAMVWLVAAFLLAEARPTLAALALAVGALVKLAPLVALPYLMRRWPWRARLTALLIVGAGLAFFWSETRGASSGVRAYWETWRNNELLFHYLERWTGSFTLARALALAGSAAVCAWLWVRVPANARATRDALRTLTLAGPVLHPWYLGWTLMFEPLAPSAPWLLLSLTATLNYGALHAPAEGRAFHPDLALRWIEYGLPLALALALTMTARLRRARRPLED